ncbi:NAD-dependent epimerase/dehydratase family protein [Noviherbaspirillum malthae]|uniref:NAD-dependent epimerase/dehydratase family protein n=1 Tax=Noviherbaspirillum malthae TaxID=1260987 RepID=UPI001E3E52B5|nr:NAD(P)-dependent oxidoreductase [Noviherbaspirillum malthae]
MNRLLITGAAGGLGKVLRERLAPFAKTLRLSDLSALGTAAPNEELFQCDLSDAAAVHEMMSGVDAVVHLGGISVEAAFKPILDANIVGVFNLYESARKLGVKRIVFASSNHVIGFYKQTDKLDADAPMRPDSLYGISKGFGELMSRFYFDRYGIETVCVRIGSSFPEPLDRRMMATYLSYDDLTELMRCALQTPNVGHTIVYGASDNRDSWWDNSKAAHLGWQPKDSSEPFRTKVEAQPQVPADDPMMVYQGGRFVTHGPFDI